MKSIDSEIAKHRLDRNFMTAIAMCDIKLDKEKNRFAVQRRLDIICASINSSDRRDSLMDSLKQALQANASAYETFKAKQEELLKQLNEEEKMTQIIVTHDPNVGSQTNRIIRIKDGVIE